MSDRTNITNILYFVGFLDLFAVSLVVPLLSKHARDIGISPSVAGVVGSIYGGLQLISSPLIGRWSDVAGRRFVLVCCLAFSAVGYFLLGMSTSLLVLVLARIPAGIFKHTQDLLRGYLADATPREEHSKLFGRINAVSSLGFIFGPSLGGHLASNPGGYGIAAMITTLLCVINLGIFKHTQTLSKTSLTDHVSHTQLSQVQGVYYALSTMGFILGPSIGGHLAEDPGGFGWAAILTGGIFVFNAVIVWLFVPEELKSKKPASKEPNQAAGLFAFAHGFRDINWTEMWDLFLVRFLMGFAVMVYRSNFVLMMEYKYDASAKLTGYITSYSGLIGTLSGFFVGRIANFYQSDSKLLLHCGIMQFVSLLAVTFSPSLWILILSLTPLSLANQVARVCSTNLLINRSQGQKKGVMLGLGGSILAFSRMISPTIGGVAQEMHVAGPSLVGTVFAGLGMITMMIAPEPAELTQIKRD